MASKSTKRWVLLSVIILVIGGVTVYNFYKDRFLEVILPQSVKQESKGLYLISYDSIVIDEVAGSVFITDINVVADTTDIRDSASTYPDVIIALHADSLRITGVETPQALINKELKASRLLVSGSKLRLLRFRESTPSAEDTSNADLIEKIYYDVLKELKLLQIDSVILRDIDFSYLDYKTRKTIAEASNLSLQLANILIDENSLRDKSRIFFSEKVELDADSIRLVDPKGLYAYGVAGLSLNSTARQLRLRSVTMRPLLGEQAFMNQFATQRDRFQIVFNELSFKGINPVLAAIGQFIADSLVINKADIRIYRDATMPRDKKNRVGEYPHQVISKLDIPFEIKKAIITNSALEYKELGKLTGKPGRVRFTNITASITNLTNKASLLRKNNQMNLKFNSTFMNIASVNVNLMARLGDKAGRFTANGSIGKFDATGLNKITEPLGLARIEKGIVDELVFSMQGDNYKAGGELTMRYNDLKVSTLKLTEDDELKKQGVKSLVANIVIKNKNPSGKSLRKGNLQQERDTNRSFFFLFWKSLLAGAKETVGMPTKASSSPDNFSDN